MTAPRPYTTAERYALGFAKALRELVPEIRPSVRMAIIGRALAHALDQTNGETTPGANHTLKDLAKRRPKQAKSARRNHSTSG